MKTTEDIIFESNDWFWYRDTEMIEKAKKKCWYSEEEIKEAILEVKQFEHHDLSKDWEIELINKLFNNNV